MKSLGHHMLDVLTSLLNLCVGIEKQVDWDSVMSELSAQIARFHKPRTAAQPFIRHRHQQIKVGIGPFGAAGAGAEQTHLGAGNGRLDLGHDRAQQRFIHHVVIAGGARRGGHGVSLTHPGAIQLHAGTRDGGQGGGSDGGADQGEVDIGGETMPP